jgi:hypothetical protein
VGSSVTSEYVYMQHFVALFIWLAGATSKLTPATHYHQSRLIVGSFFAVTSCLSSLFICTADKSRTDIVGILKLIVVFIFIVKYHCHLEQVVPNNLHLAVHQRQKVASSLRRGMIL